MIRNCNLGAHDDNIAIKSGRDADGRRINVPCQNIVVFGCRMNGNWGAITCGSEQTGGIRNVYAYKCALVGATKFALYVKSNTRRGGFSENVFLDTIEAQGRDDKSPSSGEPAGVLLLMTYNDETGEFPPKFDNINITNMKFSESPYAVRIVGAENNKVGKVTVADSTFTDMKNAENSIENSEEVKFTNVTINGNKVGG